jgi:tetratricopeptide (TPR) repeat protein
LSTATIPNFHGRTAELAQLRLLFEECAARDPATGRFGGPRMAVIIAESGIGKSRLVQALYQQLTTDLLWDPPEVNYWPDAFMDAGVQLRVTPNMAGHVAQGPPRFAWLGARFHSTDIRNLSERRSSLTELRHSIMAHAEILRAHGSAWADATGRIKHAIARDSVGETISQVADAAVPFGGLLAKLVAGGVKLVRDRTAERKSVEDASDEASKTLVDDVEESMRSLLDGKGGLPSILWLDDAQWIDAETQELLYRVWRIARERGWPLLVVITHWERPWRELRRQADGERGLVSFEGQPGVSIIELQDAEPDALRSYLILQMPGLTPDQQSLMLEKAAGNFLTMVENVGQLLRVPANFIERRTSGALCPAGERVVREWQSERHKRVEQRFTELAPEVQDLLGWSSHLGMSFLHEVVEDFADQVAGHPRAAALLQECVDPLVILGRPNDLLREFRDRAFHDVAKHYFANYGQEHAGPLEEILRKHLAEWVNNSFDNEGNEIDEERERSALSLPVEERCDFLAMAVNWLRPSASDAWADARSIAWVQAVYLLVVTDSGPLDVARGGHHCEELARAKVDWKAVPRSALSHLSRLWLVDLAEWACVFECAHYLWEAELEYAEERLGSARALMAEFGTTQSRRDVSIWLIDVASWERSRGDCGSAVARAQEALGINRALMAELGTPESRRDMYASLKELAGFKYFRTGYFDGLSALPDYEEALEIARAFMVELGTLESRSDVSMLLERIADIEQTHGDLDGALACCAEGLELDRAIKVELGTPESFSRVSIWLKKIAVIEQTRGNLDGALARYEADLEIRRALMAELGTPESRNDVGCALNQVAVIEQARGNLEGALARYKADLEIRRTLMAELGTPESRSDVGRALNQVAGIQQARGDLDDALANYLEGLEVERRLSEELGTSDSLGFLNTLVWALQRCAGVETSASRADSALARLESVLQQANRLEFAEPVRRMRLTGNGIKRVIDPGTLTAAAYWDRRTEAFDALGRSAEAAESRARALTLRARIAQMESE